MLKTIGPGAQPRPNKPMELPKSFIDSVLAATSIERVVGDVVELKKSGNNLFGLCPFHGEKSPSFSVSPQKQIYHCFGCGANGDAIGFLREHAALSFREAVTELAEAARIPLPTQEPGQSAPVQDFSGMLKANELAAAFFRHCLKHTDSAKDYLRTRRITPEAAKRFLIGYAPPGWQGLEEAFHDYKTSRPLIDLGLVIENEGRRYDRFRDRLMFGIRDARGRIVGWGGRSMDGSEPKYLNSPASSLFDKSSQLFGVFEAREKIRQTRQVVVTEGYMDTIANAMAGIEQTVATMGTACTEHHLERLCALAPEIIFSFDGDKAGQAAAWKSLVTSLPFAEDDRVFRFLLLPEGKDPDELIAERGADAYKTMLLGAQSLSSFMISKLRTDNGDLATAENRARFLMESNALIARLPANGNLRRILKEEVLKASAMTPEQARQASGHSTPASVHRVRARPTPWDAITAATKDQQASAAAQADKLIELLSPELQDAFFNSEMRAFPEQQRAFWTALDAAIIQETPQDKDSALASAQRDLLSQAPAVIAKLLEKDAVQAARQEFREGKATEDEFLDQVKALHSQSRSA